MKRQQKPATTYLLKHPALTPMPEALRGQKQPISTAASLPTTGARRVRGRRSSYSIGVGCGLGLDRAKTMRAAIPALLVARASLLRGGLLFDGVAVGTADGWTARMLLQRACDATNLHAWETAKGRTEAERLALVDRVLADCGHVRRGGWTVSR